MGLFRSKIRWTIPGAGTAFTVLHWRTPGNNEPNQADVDDVIGKMNAYVTAIRGQLGNTISLRVQEEVEQLNEDNGEMLFVWTATTPTTDQVGNNANASFAAPAGAVITWSTPGVRNGRRVRGRSFVVPLSTNTYESNGTLTSGTLTALNSGASALRATTGTCQLAVYSRPTGPGATDGGAFIVMSHRVPDMVAMLRSRRS